MSADPDVMLILRPVADPHARAGAPPRAADYRLRLALKVLLRGFGLRCVRACEVPTGVKPTDVPPTDARPPTHGNAP